MGQPGGIMEAAFLCLWKCQVGCGGHSERGDMMVAISTVL